MHYPLQWDLDCFFSGGSHSKDFINAMKSLAEKMDFVRPQNDVKLLVTTLKWMQEVDICLGECDAFILCLQAQNVSDERANQLRADFSELDAKFEVFNNEFDAFLGKLKEDELAAILRADDLAGFSFILNERRMRARKKLASDAENLITDLSIDGYRGWGEFYPTLVGEVKIEFQGKILSFGQAENQLSNPLRQIRGEVFFKLESVWKQKEALFAQVLNHIAGFRLKVYERRNWPDVLQEPLFENRMSAETLNVMWQAVEKNKKPLVDFLQAKAKLFELDQLAWYDVEAPLFEQSAETIPYEQGAELIIEHFRSFHPRMGEFAYRACSEKWIEAEDRPGKRPGGFCVQFPKSKQSRIFMTYSGTQVNLSTLAHELGHAYHTAMIEDLPRFYQHYRMNVAETASTFAEQIISDAFLKNAKTKQEKLNILSDRIERSIIFMMNIHARFLFETQFYEQRKKKFLSAQELCELMQHSQKKAFCDSLSRWHPYFWAAKMHFYFTGVPFYNFPYTFGYLFSLGLYAQSKKQGPSFGKLYDALLRDTGMMTVEELAQRHLGIDLTKIDFWNEAAALAVKDVGLFLELVNQEKDKRTKVSTCVV